MFIGSFVMKGAAWVSATSAFRNQSCLSFDAIDLQLVIFGQQRNKRKRIHPNAMFPIEKQITQQSRSYAYFDPDTAIIKSVKITSFPS
jgi:hypothetical protein